MSTQRRTAELVPLGERYQWMVICRGIITLALTVTVLLEGRRLAQGLGVLVAAAGWLVISGISVPLTRRSRHALGTAFTMGLLGDGLVLGAGWWVAGGPGTGVELIVAAHVLAATLLASFRTGVKIALWHGVVTLLTAECAAVGLLGEETPVAVQPIAIYVGGLWLITLLTATFAAVNERELRRRRYDSEALRRLGVDLSSHQPAAAVPLALARFARDEMLCARVAVYAYPVATGAEPAESGFGVLLDRTSEQMLTGLPAAGMDAVVRSARPEMNPLLISRVDPVTDPNLTGLLPGVRNLVLIPYASEQVAGVVAVTPPGSLRHRTSARVERRMVATMQHATTHAAMALSRVLLSERIRRAAETDALTGLANRSIFSAALTRAVERMRLDGQPFTVIMVDLDHFKRLNDTYGHQIGDDVLRSAATALRDACREEDLAARYGGEEFVVIATCATHEDAWTTAERIRVAIASAPAATSVTASLGLAVCPADALDATSVVAAADTALYEAKRRGRNQVVMAAEAQHHRASLHS